MSSSDKQPEGSNHSGIPYHPNPLASAPSNFNAQEDIYAPPLPPHPNVSAQGPSHPVSSGGLLPEQPLEQQQQQQQPAAPIENQETAASAIPPPPPPPAATTQSNIDQHTGVTSSSTAIPPIPQQNATNLNFPPPPTEEMADVKHPIHPPPSAAADGANAEMAGAAGPGAAAADTTQQQPGKKTWGQRFSNLGQKAAAKLGSPGFLPQPLDKECEKTAQILKAFCKNGVYADPSTSDGGLPASTNPDASVAEPGKDGAVVDPTRQKPKGKSLVTIPSSVISRAVGLAIFTTLRAGFQVTGAMGSGVLVARLPDGSWSPPSAIQVLSVGGGFQFGVDIYDCVCVINTKEALSAFMNTRVSIGGDMAVSAGPYGAGGAVEVGSTMNSKDEEERRRKNKEREAASAAGAQPNRKEDAAAAAAGAPPAPQDGSLPVPERPGAKNQRKSSGSSWKPVFSYVKSRGFYAGVQVDGTVIVERKEANAAFYGAPVRVEQILHGEVPVTQGGQWHAAARVLHDVLKGAEAGVLQKQATGAADAPLPEQFAPPPAAGPSSGPVPPAAAAGVGSAAPGPSTTTGAPRYDKAAEARAEARQSQVAPPAYEDAPPAYIDDGAHRPGVGDQKQG